MNLETFVLATPGDGATHMLTDFAPMARNAGANIWRDGAFIWGMCAEHVSGRWFDKHKALFNDQANRKKMNKDFQDYKNCTIYLLAKRGVLFAKMMDKWRGYGEAKLVEKFSSTWAHIPCARVEINHNALVPGGMPADNNGAESTNRWHKDFAKQMRYIGETYVHELAKWVHHKSVIDVAFGATLHQAVCSFKFHDAVLQMNTNPCSPVDIAFRSADGRFVITSQRFLNILERHPTQPKTAQAYINLVKSPMQGFVGQSQLSHVHQFLKGMHDPAAHCENRTFDQCVAWSTQFYIMTPIPEGNYLLGLFNRLTNSKMRLGVTYAQLLALGHDGLMSCSCSAFLHRAWCIHACVCAFKRKIIVGFPQNKDPTPRKRKGVGCAPVMKKVNWDHDYEVADDDMIADCVVIEVSD